MPFICVGIDKHNNRRPLLITQYADPRAALGKYRLVCRECGHPMHVRQGLVITPHFAHNPSFPDGRRRPECVLDGFGGESELHMRAKINLMRWIAEQDSYSGVHCEVEVVLPEVNRRADIMVMFDDSFWEAHEIQFSPITPDELEERTRDYERYQKGRIGSICWWLGGDADTQENRDWSMRRFGAVLTLDRKSVSEAYDL